MTTTIRDRSRICSTISTAHRTHPTDVSIVAAGGLMNGADIAAALAGGADAAQLGTAFLLCPEAGTVAAHRRALRSGGATTLTRCFTGRRARGIENPWTSRFGSAAPSAYPEIHHMTSPLRAHGRATGNPDLVNLWAGTGHATVREMPAADLVATLRAELAAATRSSARLGFFDRQLRGGIGLEPSVGNDCAAADRTPERAVREPLLRPCNRGEAIAEALDERVVDLLGGQGYRGVGQVAGLVRLGAVRVGRADRCVEEPLHPRALSVEQLPGLVLLHSCPPGVERPGYAKALDASPVRVPACRGGSTRRPWYALASSPRHERRARPEYRGRGTDQRERDRREAGRDEPVEARDPSEELAGHESLLRRGPHDEARALERVEHEARGHELPREVREPVARHRDRRRGPRART